MKKLLIFCAYVCISANIFAVQYWGDGVFFDLGYSSGVGIDVPIEANLGIRHTIEDASFLGAFAINGFSVDITASALYKPLQIKNFSLGLEYSLHSAKSYLPDSPNLFELDNSLYITPSFTHKTNYVQFTTSLALGLSGKTTVQKLTTSTICLFECSPAFEFISQVRLYDTHEIFFRFASFDIMRYKVWLNTWWQLGYSYDVTKNITIASLFQAAYADQSTNSGTVDGFQGKVAVIYKF